MKYYKRLKIYKASNVSFDPATNEGRSYNHWLFTMNYKDVILFNCYRYSQSTRRHQGVVLRQLGYDNDKVIRLNLGRDSLDRSKFDSFESAIVESLSRELDGQIDSYKRSRKYKDTIAESMEATLNKAIRLNITKTALQMVMKEKMSEILTVIEQKNMKESHGK